MKRQIIPIVFTVILIASCGKESPPQASQSPTLSASGNCVAEISADKSKYLETAQRLGADFSKLSKMPFSAGIENQVKSVVADSFQAIPESSVRCAIVAKLQACAINAGNQQLAAGMQDTVLKTCAAVSKEEKSGTTTPSSPSISSSAFPSRHDQWVCIPPGRRGAGTDLENEDPTRVQLGGGVLFWSGYADSEAFRCVQLLLKAGADPNYSETEPTYEGYFGGPPLHHALSQKRWEMVELLLRNGADPGRRSIWRQQTAIEIAKGWGAPETIVSSLERAKP